MKVNRRQFIKSAAAVGTVAALPGAPFIRSAAAADTIKVGILHSLTGTIAIA
jgi:urea transport system substrate-binding protein